MKNSSNQSDVYKLFHYISYLNYIIYTFVGTILFWIMNLPFLYLLLTMDLKISTLPIFVIAALSIGPAITALMTSLKNVNESNSVVRSFFKAYRSKFKISLSGWSVALIIIGLSGTNLLFLVAAGTLGLFKWLNLFILTFTLTFILNYFLLVSNFELPTFKQAFFITAKLSIIKSMRCGLSFMIVIGSWLLLNYIPIYLALFGMGIVCLLLLINFKPVSDFIQSQ